MSIRAVSDGWESGAAAGARQLDLSAAGAGAEWACGIKAADPMHYPGVLLEPRSM
jgi:hypothetical protein